MVEFGVSHKKGFTDEGGTVVWFGLFSCLIGLNLGFVWDGPRPIMHFEAMGHATLSPLSCY